MKERAHITQASPPATRALILRVGTWIRPFRGQVALAALAALVAALAGSGFTAVVGPLLHGVLTGAEGAWPVLHLAGLVVGLAGARALAMWLHTGLMQAVAQQVLARLRADLHRHVLALGPGWHQAHHSGEVVARFSLDVDRVELTVGQILTSALRDGLQVVALLGACLVIDLRLFALAFVVVPLMAWPVSRFAKALKKVAVGAQQSLGGLTVLAAETLQNLAVVQTTQSEGLVLAKADEEHRVYLGLMRRSLLVRGAFTPTLEVLGIAGVALALALGVRAVQLEPALAPKLLSFLAAALLVYQPVKGLSGAFGQLSQGLAAAGRLTEVLDAELMPDDGAPCGPLTRALEFEGVRVRFGDGREGLQGLDLSLPAGKLVALVGESGSGKTTVLRTVLRLLEPSAGLLRWDGTPLSTIAPSSLRAQVAWMPQEAVVLSGTVRDNLQLAKPGATDAQMWEALAAAHADAFVRARPGALDAGVGERGSQLSGGQRQRLALARVFLAAPSVLLLDEPTSALDAESQAAVEEGLRALRPGRLVLMAAHRLETVREADLVVVLKGGQVVRQGAPSVVLEDGGARR